MPGPFYKPGAPLRESVGKGFLLTGTVRSAKDCLPIPEAQIEFWLAGPDGKYQDAYRATVNSDSAGNYSFESHSPPGYGGRPPHIHIRVQAQGHEVLITQLYPKKGATEAKFDLVLVPSR
jgi:protocatechuate 3,4-dioxygenase beta subunit